MTIASINYFGDLCKPWYRRDGRQITDAIRCVQEHFDTILNDCARLDARLAEDAAARRARTTSGSSTLRGATPLPPTS